MLRTVFLSLLPLIYSCGNIDSSAIQNNSQADRNLEALLAKVNLQNPSEYHLVKLGETLYSIARFYQLDYKILAFHNAIDPPYTIFPGQKILLKKQVAKLDAVDSQQKKLPSVEQYTKPAPTQDGQTTSWIWPAKGKIVKRFMQTGSNSPNQGIDIAVRPGTQIKASRSGQVVYHGTGLVGFGKVVIVKHKNNFLSAYTHNDTLHVQEGQSVTQGQVIGTVGSEGNRQAVFHFEVRKNGKPIDPLSVLD